MRISVCFIELERGSVGNGIWKRLSVVPGTKSEGHVVVVVLWVSRGRGCELGRLHVGRDCGRDELWFLQDVREEDPVDPKVGGREDS